MSFQSLAFFGFLAAALAVCLTAGRRSPRAGAAMLAALVWDDGWQVRPVSETFLRRERDFGITVLSDEVWCGSPERCFLAVTYGEEAYLLSGGLSPWELIYYQRLDGQGGGTIIRYDPGTVKVRTLGEVLPKEAYWTNTGFLLPVYVECISADDDDVFDDDPHED